MAFTFQTHEDWAGVPPKEQLDPNNPLQRQFFIKSADMQVVENLFLNNFAISDGGIINGILHDLDMNGNSINNVSAINPSSPLIIGSNKVAPFTIDTDNSLIGFYNSSTPGNLAGFLMNSVTGETEFLSFYGSISFTPISGHPYPIQIISDNINNIYTVSDVICSTIGLVSFSDNPFGSSPATMYGGVNGIDGPNPAITLGGGLFYSDFNESFAGTGADNQVVYLTHSPRYPNDASTNINIHVDSDTWNKVVSFTGASHEYIYDPIAGTVTFGTNAHDSAPGNSSIIQVLYISGSYLDGVQNLDLMLLTINVGPIVHVTWMTMSGDTSSVFSFLDGMSIVVDHTIIYNAYIAHGLGNNYTINSAAFNGAIKTQGDIAARSISCSSFITNAITTTSISAPLVINCDTKSIAQFGYFELSPTHHAAILSVGMDTSGDIGGELCVNDQYGDSYFTARETGVQLDGTDHHPEISFRLQNHNSTRAVELTTDSAQPAVSTGGGNISMGSGQIFFNSSNLIYQYSGTHTWNLPDNTGTFALTTDIGGLTGTTADSFIVDSNDSSAAGGILYGGTGTNRVLILATNPADWSFSSPIKGGVVALENNAVNLSVFASSNEVMRFKLDYDTGTPANSHFTFKYGGNEIASINSLGDIVIGESTYGGAGGAKIVASSLISAQRTITIPDADGTLALTSDISANKRQGIATFASSGTVVVSFATLVDTNYRISLALDSNENIYYVSGSKTATGFTIASSNPVSTANVDWIVIHD